MEKAELNKRFDIIIAGAGASGLTLAYLIYQKTPHKKVLIIEKGKKTQNDRTWCFWTKSNTVFDSIVFKRWNIIKFKNKSQERIYDISPYQYQMIRGIDFYNFVLNSLKGSENISVINDEVIDYEQSSDSVKIITKGGIYTSELFFNSIPPTPPEYISNRNNFLLQHFKGSIIKTEKPSFDSSVPNFMDFSVDQNGETRFGYVLPITENEALIEFTLFSESLLEDQEYQILLKQYISENLGINEYHVMENEFGIIPMTDIPFQKTEGKRVFNIGYRSGMTKGSSGYTFLNIQKECHHIVECLANNESIRPIAESRKFKFFDSVLLHVLAKNLLPADKVFSDLFFKNKVELIFKFLDEDTSFIEDIKILTSLPTFPFLKGAYLSLFSSGMKKIKSYKPIREEVKS